MNNTLMSPDNTWLLWSVCVLCASAAIVLEQKFRWAAKITGTLLALFIAMALSNLKVIPMECEVWDTIWNCLAPLCIPMLLIKCNLKCLGRDVGRVLTVFLIGALGTAFGTIMGYFMLRNSMPELGKLAGVFTGTYIGGGSNFTDICKTLGITTDLASAATVADNGMMALYFVVLTWIPSVSIFKSHFRHPLIDDVEADSEAAERDDSGLVYIPAYSSGGPISLKDIALTISISIVIAGISYYLSSFCSEIIPATNIFTMILGMILGNIYVWICGISIASASLGSGFFGRINGTNEIGTFIIYLVFFTIGAKVSFPLLFSGSAILLLYALIAVLVNMVFCFAFGRLLGCSLEEIIIASNANIGGPTTAAAMAVTKGWNRMIGPGVIVGVLGYTVGTYLGLVVGSLLGV